MLAHEREHGVSRAAPCRDASPISRRRPPLGRPPGAPVRPAGRLAGWFWLRDSYLVILRRLVVALLAARPGRLIRRHHPGGRSLGAPLSHDAGSVTRSSDHLNTPHHAGYSAERVEPVSQATVSTDRVAEAMQRLCSAERARREVIDELIKLGVVKSRRLVADLGEALAGRYYGVALAPNANNPGYDLETTEGRRVQVRTLRSEPHRERTLMGAMKEPYDVLLAIKLSVDYEPLRAIEVARSVLEQHYPHGARTSWTKQLENDPQVRRIPKQELTR